MQLRRRGVITDIRARNQMFGGEPLWAVSPYLANGSALTENYQGNLQLQNGGATTIAPVNSMALQSLGDFPSSTYAVEFNGTLSGSTLTVHSITSGGNNLLQGAGTPNRLRIRSTAQPANASEFYITAAGTGTGGVGTYTVAGDLDNMTAQPMRALSPTGCSDGTPALQVVEVNDKKRYRIHAVYDDFNAVTQQGQKVLIRAGDNGTEVSNGLNVLGYLGAPQVFGFSIEVPAATRDTLNRFDYILFWQHKDTDAAGDPRIVLDFTTQTYRPDNATPPGGGTVPGAPCVMALLDLPPYTTNLRVVDGLPADTPIHFIIRWVPGIAQAASSKTYCGGEYVHNAGNVYRMQGGRSTTGVSGVGTPPTTTGSGIVDGTCLWDYVQALPASNVEPVLRIWVALGDAAHTNPVDLRGSTLARTLFDITVGTTGFPMSYGYYGRPYLNQAATPGFSGTTPTWGPGAPSSELTYDYSEMTQAARAYVENEPTEALLSAWFAGLRARF